MKNESIPQLRPIIKATKGVGLEARNLLDGSLFSEADRGLLKLLKDSLADEENRKTLLDILGSRKGNPAPLSKIVNVVEKFTNLAEIELTKDDIQLLNFTIKYFENWFHSGEWAKVSHKQNKNLDAYAYFSVPAGIINLVTKFKDSRKSSDELISFDLKMLEVLQKEVEGFATQLLSTERLERILGEKLSPGKRKKIEYIFNNREAMLRTFYKSERSVQNELQGGNGSSGSHAPDLYLLKTCLVAAEMSRRDQLEDSSHYVFIPDKDISQSGDRYQWFDFSQGKNKYSSMHYPKDRISYCKFLVEYLRSRK